MVYFMGCTEHTVPPWSSSPWAAGGFLHLHSFLPSPTMGNAGQFLSHFYLFSACAVFFALSEISFHQGTTSSAVGLSHGLRCLLELARSGCVRHGAGLSSQRPLQALLPKPQHRHPIQKPKLLSFYHCACITHSFTCFWPLTL